MPDLGQVPEIDVPSYLPDLPGIAADLMYSADLGPGIAPSAPSSAIPELPTFNTESVEPLQQGTSSPCSQPGEGWSRAGCVRRKRRRGGGPSVGMEGWPQCPGGWSWGISALASPMCCTGCELCCMLHAAGLESVAAEIRRALC